MSNDLNQCQFIGRLGKDPETRYMPDGKAVTNFSIAVGSQWKSKDGEKQESTEWVNCTTYEKLAEICGEYLKKGSQVFIGGRMKTRKWQDKEGKDRYTTEIIVERMQMLGGKSDSKPQAEKPDRQPSQAAPTTKAASFDNFDDDIPF